MEVSEAKRRLKLFEIPGGEDKPAEDVRDILARLLASRIVSLGELQVARDIVGRAGEANPHAFLFLAAMFVSLRGGNTAFNPANEDNANGKLLSDACRIREYDEDAEEVAGQLKSALDDAWPEALRAAESLSGDIVEQDSGLWYFSKYRDAVKVVARLIQERNVSSGVSLPDDAVEAVAHYYGDDGDEPLNNGQRDAVRAAVANRLAVVTGGPGTGKTTVLCSILRALFRMGLKPADVALVAPTARAGRRIGESLDRQCEKAEKTVGADKAARDILGEITSLSDAGGTIHSLLGGFPPNWMYSADNPLPHRLVVVDECSMVDLLLMRSLLSALRKDCRLVLLGDRNQLPSVDAGAVLGDLTELFEKDCAGKGAFVELTETYRFKGMLKQCADEFNKGESATILSSRAHLPQAEGGKWTDALADEGTENGCFWHELARIDKETDKAFHERVDALLLDWAKANGLDKSGTLVQKAQAITDGNAAFTGGCTPEAIALFKALDASRVLTVVRKGPFGVGHVNDLLLKERLGRSPAQPLIEVGIPVIVTKNTPNLLCGALFNGDVGVTVRRGDDICVLFPRGKKVVCCPASQLPEHELAYAITVHKSQGSEYGNVLVMLPDDETHPLLKRQLVYTGITRAKWRAVILGTKAALMTAIDNKLERDTGIVRNRRCRRAS